MTPWCVAVAHDRVRVGDTIDFDCSGVDRTGFYATATAFVMGPELRRHPACCFHSKQSHTLTMTAVADDLFDICATDHTSGVSTGLCNATFHNIVKILGEIDRAMRIAHGTIDL